MTKKFRNIDHPDDNCVPFLTIDGNGMTWYNSCYEGKDLKARFERHEDAVEYAKQHKAIERRKDLTNDQK